MQPDRYVAGRLLGGALLTAFLAANGIVAVVAGLSGGSWLLVLLGIGLLGGAAGSRRRTVRPADRSFHLDLDGAELIYRVDGTEQNRLCDWVRAHDLDPNSVVVPQTATIRDGWLTLELYRVDAAGHHYVDPADHTRAARETVTVRLMDNPPDCWIRRAVSRGTA